MITVLSKWFINDYEAYQNPVVRQSYGVLCSIISIIANIILSIFKLITGSIANSVSIQADGLNNLSDVGSNIAALLGFKLANKHPDKEHPYGHGRMEYISGLVIAFLTVLVGFQALRDSFFNIINPEKITFSTLSCMILVISIGIKLWMSYFNKEIANKIDSATLLVASQDSINDVIITSATLLALILSPFTSLPIDGIFGVGVSFIVLKAGYERFKDTVDPLLGKAPDTQLLKEIESLILSHEVTLGLHDMIMHDYGPGRKFMTLHVEVDANLDIMVIHDAIDAIEREILNKYQIAATIHMDPVDMNDVLTNELRAMVEEIVKTINESYTIHDFRIVNGLEHTKLIFDVLIPISDMISHKELRSLIHAKINETDGEYLTIIQIGHSYV
jgi:cation diffusion facilitator family transporter